MIDTEHEPARPPPGAWRRIRKGAGDLLCSGLAAVFALATLALCIGFSSERWNGSLQILGLAGVAVLAVLLGLRSWWLRGHGQPAFLAWCDRRWKWILAAWGLVLAAAGFGLVLQDQLRTREGTGFQNAMGRVEGSAELAARLGSPIRPGWWVGGGQSVSKLGSCWDLEFSISGPKGSGKVRARGTPQLPEPSESVLVTIDGTGERLELVKSMPARKGR